MSDRPEFYEFVDFKGLDPEAAIAVPAELVEEIESSVPEIIVLPDESALWWFEVAHAAVDALGLSGIHETHCLDPGADDPDLLVKVAASAEAMLNNVKAWLVEHEVPVLSLWYPSALRRDFCHVAIGGTQPSS